MTGPREQAREIVEAWWAANPTVDSRGSRDLVVRIAAALDEAQRGAPTGAESVGAQPDASSLREAGTNLTPQQALAMFAGSIGWLRNQERKATCDCGACYFCAYWVLSKAIGSSSSEAPARVTGQED